ncbi:hypothetical protein A2714_00265 [Candidatus Woesebacteria bacterium RIFCSPHIGHO2_01_FULL_38_9]|uniref:Metallopeptidase family protein n=2 Tax=Candidatus Woeseibacteriota TaxID=1752722 RepID=A0A1F7Y4F8_9BACT|nr:MAG: hypothetical protein A2714_00265 [Candidatus Woesebacteria bacterium RIFCSPHIGHO2_01_FULL_38_9]OGM58241.1 MAG: hypothetical protein A3A75_04350 [Candidatus Woesebacteria bacterium RIFCSPLOWO2_01_FULL_39_10]
MSDDDFQKLIKESVLTIPEEFRKKLENVTIVYEDWPKSHQLGKLSVGNQRSLILGLYEGVPQTRRGHYGVGGTLPDKITLFKIPILMVAGNSQNVKKVIQDTVIHEVAHHFGISDETIAKLTREKTSQKLD